MFSDHKRMKLETTKKETRQFYKYMENYTQDAIKRLFVWGSVILDLRINSCVTISKSSQEHQKKRFSYLNRMFSLKLQSKNIY